MDLENLFLFFGLLPESPNKRLTSVFICHRYFGIFLLLSYLIKLILIFIVPTDYPWVVYLGDLPFFFSGEVERKLFLFVGTFMAAASLISMYRKKSENYLAWIDILNASLQDKKSLPKLDSKELNKDVEKRFRSRVKVAAKLMIAIYVFYILVVLWSAADVCFFLFPPGTLAWQILHFVHTLLFNYCCVAIFFLSIFESYALCYYMYCMYLSIRDQRDFIQ